MCGYYCNSRLRLRLSRLYRRLLGQKSSFSLPGVASRQRVRYVRIAYYPPGTGRNWPQTNSNGTLEVLSK